MDEYFWNLPMHAPQLLNVQAACDAEIEENQRFHSDLGQYLLLPWSYWVNMAPDTSSIIHVDDVEEFSCKILCI